MRGALPGGMLFGINGSGKSNLGLALFDLVCHLTDKQTLSDNYRPYLNAAGGKAFAEFEYVFVFQKEELVYQYGKTDLDRLVYERLWISGSEAICYDYRTNEGFVRLKGAETLNQSIAANSAISRVKFVSSNAILADNAENAAFFAFMDFVNRMLLFYSLDKKGYEGFRSGKGNIAEGIIDRGRLSDFQSFLKKTESNTRCPGQRKTARKGFYAISGKRLLIFSILPLRGQGH